MFYFFQSSFPNFVNSHTIFPKYFKGVGKSLKYPYVLVVKMFDNNQVHDLSKTVVILFCSDEVDFGTVHLAVGKFPW